jgi:putative radical SAM enzyme (TIGR03279 family)
LNCSSKRDYITRGEIENRHRVCRTLQSNAARTVRSPGLNRFCYTFKLMYTELFETIYPINTPTKGKGVIVTAVDPFGLGDETGIEAGDRIMKVNGRVLGDFIDFQFYTGSEDRVRLDIVRKSGELIALDVEVGEGEVWGLDFEYFSPRQCANDCIFCFCNQNPKGSRESLFFKDEDTRLSFLHGNYTTMSSISKLELDRIIEQRLSPQYVSVHATDPEVRRYLLGRKRPDDVLAKMRYLAEHDVDLHAQIVLCPEINDGRVLRQTVNDLAELHPQLRSVAIVPVVFTKLHNYYDRLTAVSDAFSRKLIKEVRSWQREFRRRFGTTFVFLADEFYLRAGVPLPGRSHYGDYPQIEDGVGMVRRFVTDATKTLSRAGSDLEIRPNSLRGTVATGELFYPILSRYVSDVNERFKTKLKVVSVRNQFFGEEVTVAGLLSGSDVLTARREVEGEFLIVPEQACLKSGHVFLDDLTLEDLERELQVPVRHGGPSLLSMLTVGLTAGLELEQRLVAGETAARASADIGG